MSATTGWRRRAVVAAGGAIGTAARFGLSTLMGDTGGFPVATLTANLVGAFLLAVALRALVPLGRPGLSSFVTTGILGALTTFSTFAVEALDLYADEPALAVAYLAASAVLGPLVARAGLRVGDRP